VCAGLRLFAGCRFERNVLRLGHLGLKPEATAEGSQLKRAVGSFEVNLSSKLVVRFDLAM
jgi:hypothetical protein